MDGVELFKLAVVCVTALTALAGWVMASYWKTRFLECNNLLRASRDGGNYVSGIKSDNLLLRAELMKLYRQADHARIAFKLSEDPCLALSPFAPKPDDPWTGLSRGVVKREVPTPPKRPDDVPIYADEKQLASWERAAEGAAGKDAWRKEHQAWRDRGYIR